MSGARRRPVGRPLRAAQYLRMSTEHQRYSLDNQATAILAYARRARYQIVRTYADAGVSGLTLKRRPGLQALLADAVGGDPGYEVILVYDVSRWGRFQNPDQSAHYEYLCVQAGVRVEYVQEPFDNDDSLASTILKTLTRVMAAKYSRDLSVKVKAGMRRLAQSGYWQNSSPGLGLRRQMVDPVSGESLTLERGQRKAIQGRHTTLVPGPEVEVALVNRIYRLYVASGMKRRAIVRLLNAEGQLTDRGTPWTTVSLATVLGNPKYAGDLLFNRMSRTLSGRTVRHPRAAWKTVRQAWPGIVERKLFEAAQARQRASQVHMDTDELLARLREVWSREGELSIAIIGNAPGLPTIPTIRRRFGGMGGLYARLGYERKIACGSRGPHLTDEQILWRLARLMDQAGRLSVRLVRETPGIPHPTTLVRRFGSSRLAFALVGHVEMSATARASPIGQARLQAARAARAAWLDGPDPGPPSGAG